MNKQIIDTLSQQLNLYRKDKSKKWKAIALQKAINSIKGLDFEVKSSADVKGVKGIGKGMLDRIDEILSTGTLEDLAAESINIDLLNKFKAVTGVGDVKAEQWIKDGFKSINDVLVAVASGKLEVTHHIQVGLKYYKDFQERIPRSEIEGIEKFFGKILVGFNRKLTYHICGSYRRGCTDSGDVDIIITEPNATDDIHGNKYLTGIVEACKSAGFIVDDLTTLGEKKYMGVCKVDPNGKARRIDIRCFNYGEYYAALLYFTGSKNFNVLVRQKANVLGYSLNEYGLITKSTGELHPLKSEEELFKILNIPYLSPTERDF